MILVYTRIMTTNHQYKIGIDCRLSGDTHAGIGRYVEELILRLPKLTKDTPRGTSKKLILFFYSKKQSEKFLQKLNFQSNNNLKIVIAPIKHYSLNEQIKLPQIFSKEKLDILHVPHFNVPIFYKGKIIVTIHDLLWHEFKGLAVTTLKPHIYYLKYLAYRFITKMAIKKANKIIVPAKTIKETVIKYFPWAKDKIIITKEGHSDKFKFINHNKKPNKTFLYVGSLYPHKNITVILKALKSLPTYDLEIIGSRNVFQDQIREEVTKLGISKQVNFLGYLSDEQLNKRMSKSFALVQPSLSEGFGLTGIEAMSAGIPVIASNIPIFKEIYQDGAIFFDPKYPTDFVKATNILEKLDRKEIIQKGKLVSSQYSWDKMAKETFQLY